MNIKKWICVFLALALCAAVFAACAKTPVNEPEQTTAAEDVAADDTTAEAAAADDTTAEAAPADDTADETAEDEAVIEIPEADRTTANLAGTYSNDRCNIVVEAVDESTLKFSVHWANSVSQANEWEMSGTFDPDTLRVNYSDCVCKTVFYAEDGTATEQVEYEDGVGRIQFRDLSSLVWNDEQGNMGLGLTFTKAEPAE